MSSFFLDLVRTCSVVVNFVEPFFFFLQLILSVSQILWFVGLCAESCYVIERLCCDNMVHQQSTGATISSTFRTALANQISMCCCCVITLTRMR
jgi:hypothetical protein